MTNYDVIVVGGGFAGVAAAIAAAREGSKVLLLEQSGAMGGVATTGLVMPFMRYYTTVINEQGEHEALNLVRGIFQKIVDAMAEYGACRAKSSKEFNGEYLKVVLDRMLAEYGVDVLFHATLCGVKTEGRLLKEVSVATVGGVLTFGAKCFVDASGDATLGAYAGANFQLGREEDGLCQPMTLCFRVSNVKWEEMRSQLGEMQKLYKQYHDEGKIKNHREDILLFKTVNENEIHFNSTRVIKLNPTDAFELSKAEAEAREQMLELFHFLKDNFSSFADACITVSGPSIGVRESRMIVGEHRLTGKELIDVTKFEDAIAAGNYDIDIHNPEGAGTSHHYFKAGTYYTIPYRSLVAADFDNLLVSGRCISCDHQAQASIRIMPICCATGEAAGVGAAVAVKSECAAKDVDVTEVQKILKENGAFF